MQTSLNNENYNDNTNLTYEKQPNNETPIKNNINEKALKINTLSLFLASVFKNKKIKLENYWKILLKLPKDKKSKIFILSGISKMLSNKIILVKANQNYPEIIQEQKINIFSLQSIPKEISLLSYIYRIFKHSKIEYTTFFLSLIYLEKFLSKEKIQLTDFNIFKLLSISFLIATKYNEDKIYTNDYYAKIIGVSLSELNYLENYFLEKMEFRLYIGKEEMKEKFNKIYETIFLDSKKFL